MRIKNTRITLSIISLLQIIGGITGLGLIAYLMLQTNTINGTVLLIFLIGLGLFSFSIYSGKRLLTDERRGGAIILSIINQAFQLFQWSILGYGMSYSSGAEFTLGIQGLSLNFNIAALISTFKMSINSENDFFIKINIFAILVIIVLLDILKELNNINRKETQKQEVQIDELKEE